MSFTEFLTSFYYVTKATCEQKFVHALRISTTHGREWLSESELRQGTKAHFDLQRRIICHVMPNMVHKRSLLESHDVSVGERGIYILGMLVSMNNMFRIAVTECIGLAAVY